MEYMCGAIHVSRGNPLYWQLTSPRCAANPHRRTAPPAAPPAKPTPPPPPHVYTATPTHAPTPPHPHHTQVMHRDVKADNVLLVAADPSAAAAAGGGGGGGAGRPAAKLMDFGLMAVRAVCVVCVCVLKSTRKTLRVHTCVCVHVSHVFSRSSQISAPPP